MFNHPHFDRQSRRPSPTFGQPSNPAAAATGIFGPFLRAHAWSRGMQSQRLQKELRLQPLPHITSYSCYSGERLLAEENVLSVTNRLGGHGASTCRRRSITFLLSGCSMRGESKWIAELMLLCN